MPTAIKKKVREIMSNHKDTRDFSGLRVLVVELAFPSKKKHLLAGVFPYLIGASGADRSPDKPAGSVASNLHFSS